MDQSGPRRSRSEPPACRWSTRCWPRGRRGQTSSVGKRLFRVLLVSAQICPKDKGNPLTQGFAMRIVRVAGLVLEGSWKKSIVVRRSARRRSSRSRFPERVNTSPQISEERACLYRQTSASPTAQPLPQVRPPVPVRALGGSASAVRILDDVVQLRSLGLGGRGFRIGLPRRHVRSDAAALPSVPVSRWAAASPLPLAQIPAILVPGLRNVGDVIL